MQFEYNENIRGADMINKDEFNQKDFDYCKSEFKKFLEIQYHDISDINKQIKLFCHKFCFDDLYDIEKCKSKKEKDKYIEYSYGSNDKDIWDCDDTHLARVVLFLIHCDREGNKYAIPKLYNFIEIGSGYKYKYRGDTLNTYSTLFGSKNQGYDKFFEKNEEIEKFRNKYVTIGNFMLLPALSVQLDENKRKWDSINTFRGINEHYRDFFDLFLYKFLNKHKDFEPWRKKPYNNEYIKEYFKLTDNKNEYIKRNLLERYLEDNGEISANIFGHIDTENPYCWWGENIYEKKYREFALGYIEKATEIINYRAEKITKYLQKIYK